MSKESLVSRAWECYLSSFPNMKLWEKTVNIIFFPAIFLWLMSQIQLLDILERNFPWLIEHDEGDSQEEIENRKEN